MGHPLEGAFLRVDRAREHLADFDGREQQWRDAHTDHLAYKFNRVTQRVQTHWTGGGDPDPIMAVLVGETIYNLRAALDYLVYELVIEDSGRIRKGTQFPIFSEQAEFDRRCKDYLRGVSASHVTMIEALQPYSGCLWTKTLSSISNPDKHMKLTDSRATMEHLVRMEYGSIIDFFGRPGKVFPAQGLFQGLVCDVYVEANVILNIEFTDQTPVLKTLELLCTNVGDTLDTFRPEFKRVINATRSPATVSNVQVVSWGV